MHQTRKSLLSTIKALPLLLAFSTSSCSVLETEGEAGKPKKAENKLKAANFEQAMGRVTQKANKGESPEGALKQCIIITKEDGSKSILSCPFANTPEVK